ncbi:hypothetical protein GQ43DRAFT_297934 [Delitschia confertaspora ATCC 74209]|uniref:Uncharacterized protein n=1 Tax=Delitschia confertaspora ATCC 74209 TaxID=1513339 RepID=A0A9P4N0E7_9PLEO|nr:hypothetical protein GQ43DRAFT_297934 [Delitschia confertaspora ATCC 74209]
MGGRMVLRFGDRVDGYGNEGNGLLLVGDLSSLSTVRGRREGCRRGSPIHYESGTSLHLLTVSEQLERLFLISFSNVERHLLHVLIPKRVKIGSFGRYELSQLYTLHTTTESLFPRLSYQLNGSAVGWYIPSSKQSFIHPTSTHSPCPRRITILSPLTSNRLNISIPPSALRNPSCSLGFTPFTLSTRQRSRNIPVPTESVSFFIPPQPGP